MTTPRPALSAREFRHLLPRVSAAFAAADRVILRHLHGVRVGHKADGSEVTVADRGAEKILRGHLAASWPRDAVLGEEYGGELPATGRCWLLDPIDGTASYVLGIPMFGTLLSLVIDGEPVFGCIHLGGLGETTYAALGHGCWLARDGARARRVRVAPPVRLAQATVGLTSYRESDLARRRGPWALSRVIRAAGRIRLVGDCVQYALLCRGAVDACIDPKMNPWDIAALVPCVTEAGASCGALDGATTGLLARSSFVAASSPALRRAIVRQVAGPR